jgi:hypothetical protein
VHRIGDNGYNNSVADLEIAVAKPLMDCGGYRGALGTLGRIAGSRRDLCARGSGGQLVA